MSFFSLLGAVEIGLIFSLVALGVFISFRLLRFPDLTVDGSFPLGGAVCAILISTGTNAWVATLAATAAGAGRHTWGGMNKGRAKCTWRLPWVCPARADNTQGMEGPERAYFTTSAADFTSSSLSLTPCFSAAPGFTNSSILVLISGLMSPGFSPFRMRTTMRPVCSPRSR